MLRRSCLQLLSLSRSDMCATYVFRTSIHTCGTQMAKKKKDPPAATATKTTKAPDSSKAANEYSSGELFFSYNAYSFYDIENDMSKHRIEQPSSLQTKPTS